RAFENRLRPCAWRSSPFCHSLTAQSEADSPDLKLGCLTQTGLRPALGTESTPRPRIMRNRGVRGSFKPTAPTNSRHRGETSGQHQSRVLQAPTDVGEELRDDLAVDDTVIGADRQRGDLTRNDLVAHHPRLLPDLPEREDRGLTRIDDRRTGIDSEDA